MDVLPDPRTKPTITVEEAAKLMHVSRSSGYLAARNGEIPTVKIGRRILVPTAKLAELLGLPADEGVS